MITFRILTPGKSKVLFLVTWLPYTLQCWTSPPLRHSCLAGYKENTKMSQSCFLSLPSHNPVGMRCGFRNSCPTWPNRASWGGRGWGRTRQALRVAAVAAPAGGIRDSNSPWALAPQAAQRSERPLGPRDWTISPIASRTLFGDVAPDLASHSSHPHPQTELSYSPSEKSC